MRHHAAPAKASIAMKDLRQTRRPVLAPALAPAGAGKAPTGRHIQELLAQADVALALGSPFVAAVLRAASRQIWRAPLTAALMADWPGDLAAAAMAMRLNAALHGLARRAVLPGLTRLYQEQHGDFDAVLGEVLARHDDFIAQWMQRPTQTNEVGRAAAIWAALMVAGQGRGLPFELLELGASSGLNLNLAHYAYDLGGLMTGARASGVHIRPVWRGAPPQGAPVAIHSARGVDLHPLDAAQCDTRQRLMAYVWADDAERSARLDQALTLAVQNPPVVDKGGASAWLGQHLQTRQPAGVCRVVFHSMVLQYLDRADRAGVASQMAAAGAKATAERPLAWISFEWSEDRGEVELLLTCWPQGQTRRLAICHPYGHWIDWRG